MELQGTSDFDDSDRPVTPPTSNSPPPSPPRPPSPALVPPVSISFGPIPGPSTSPRTTPPRSTSPGLMPPISISFGPIPGVSTSPRSSPPRPCSPGLMPPVSISFGSYPEVPTSPRRSPLRSASPRASPLRSTSPRTSPMRSTSPRTPPLRSSSPRSSPPPSSPPPSTPLISTRLRLTPSRSSRMKVLAARSTYLKSTPSRRARMRLRAATASTQGSDETSSLTTTTTTTTATATATTSTAAMERLSVSPVPSTSSMSLEPSTSSQPSTSAQASKRCRTWDPTTDFEIEKIVGYHRDQAEQMWYFVKWKGWSERYNTYEPIENMTGCNYLLMKYFEYKKPSERAFAAKDKEITDSLENYEVFQKLQESNYKKEDLDEFSETCVNISKMFKKGSFVAFCKMIKKEYEYIIRCLIGMCIHQDEGLIRRAKNYKIVLKMIKLRRKQLRENLACQNFISTMETTEVKIENYADLDIFPSNLTYVVDLKPGEGIVIPTDPTVGCECENGCSAKSHCCGEMASTVFAYNRYRRVRSLERFAIYECNRRCACPPECLNRVVQHGMKVKLCIFKTNSCGWGVKTLERIPKGTFICEYVGELISDAEAVVRDIEYYKKNSSYVFDLDFSPDHDTNMYCIDATKYGNLARFINHSCNPNLVVYPVWIDCLEPNLHRLAFFARRTIKKDEELCIDYENAQDGRVPVLSKEDEEKKGQRTLRTLSRIRCRCGAQGCREWVFGN